MFLEEVKLPLDMGAKCRTGSRGQGNISSRTGKRPQSDAALTK